MPNNNTKIESFGYWTYHLISGQPVSFLLDACLGAFAANSQGLHHQPVLHSQAQLSGRLFGVHAKHTAQVPAQVGVDNRQNVLTVAIFSIGSYSNMSGQDRSRAWSRLERQLIDYFHYLLICWLFLIHCLVVSSIKYLKIVSKKKTQFTCLVIKTVQNPKYSIQ